MALTDTAIRNSKPKGKPYKVTDSLGLYLLVNPGGSKLWRVRYRRNGVERKLSLGPYPAITLAEARSARDEARRLLADVLARIAEHPVNRLDELLPWKWKSKSLMLTSDPSNIATWNLVRTPN